MRFQTLLVLLFVAMFTLNTMVIACGDCTPEERAAEIAAAEKKKKEEKKDKAKEKVKKDKKKKEVKKVTDKKKDKKKEVMGFVPPPPPAVVMGLVPPPPPAVQVVVPTPPPPAVVMGLVPPPPPAVQVVVPSPPPPSGSEVQAFTPLGVDIRQEAQGFVIEQCLNQLGGFKAQNNVAAAASPGVVALRVIDCVCCQYAVNILADNYDESCGQLDTDFPVVTSEFDYCARCSDNDGCKKCFVSPDFGNANADLSVIKECIVADTGITPPNVLPTSAIVNVNNVGTTGTLASDLDVCPPPNPPCTITRGGQTITLG